MRETTSSCAKDPEPRTRVPGQFRTCEHWCRRNQHRLSGSKSRLYFPPFLCICGQLGAKTGRIRPIPVSRFFTFTPEFAQVRQSSGLTRRDFDFASQCSLGLYITIDINLRSRENIFLFCTRKRVRQSLYGSARLVAQLIPHTGVDPWSPATS